MNAERLAHLVGEKRFPYVFYGAMIFFVAAAMPLYNILPKKLTIPLGISCWAIAFILVYWYILWGPGALKT